MPFFSAGPRLFTVIQADKNDYFPSEANEFIATFSNINFAGNFQARKWHEQFYLTLTAPYSDPLTHLFFNFLRLAAVHFY